MFSTITGPLVLALLNFASASTQTPNAASCSENPDNDVVTVSDIVVYNAVIGGEMSFEYAMDVSEELSGLPLTVFEMSSGGKGLPCFRNVGSCTYRMCEGDSKVEKQIGAPWNNECPIAADSYQSDVNVTIPSLAKYFIEESKLHIKVQVINSNEELGCTEFDVTVEGV